jgi:hypothetical protein
MRDAEVMPQGWPPLSARMGPPSRAVQAAGPVPPGEGAKSIEDILDRVKGFDGTHFSPAAFVDAVNALHALGKQRALAVLSGYVAGLDSRRQQNLYLFLRALFDVPNPPGHMPTMYIGAIVPKAPADPRDLPRYPLALIGDVPLLLCRGTEVLGTPRFAVPYLDYFRRSSSWRDKPLKPTGAALDVLLEADHLLDRAYADHRDLDRQLSTLRMVIQQLRRISLSSPARGKAAFGSAHSFITGLSCIGPDWPLTSKPTCSSVPSGTFTLIPESQ